MSAYRFLVYQDSAKAVAWLLDTNAALAAKILRRAADAEMKNPEPA